MDTAVLDGAMIRIWLFRSAPLALILWAACGMPPESPEASSAGDHAPDLFTPPGEPSRVSDTPLFVLGASDTLPLGRVDAAGGAVLFQGGVAVANGRFNEVLVFDGSGRLVWRRGRTGQGPGEYISLAQVARFGDGLVTSDRYNLRFTRLDARGERVSVTTVQPPPDGWVEMIGTFGSSLLLEVSRPGFEEEGVTEPEVLRSDVRYEIIRVSDGEIVWDTLVPGPERWSVQRGTMKAGKPVIFGRGPVAAVAHDRAYVGTTDSGTLARYDDSGRGELVSFGLPSVAAPEEWVRVVRDTLHEYNEGTPERLGAETATIRRRVEVLRYLLRDLPARSTIPGFSGLIGGADGRLWIKQYVGPEADHEIWVAVGEGGDPEEWLEVPTDLQVLDLSEDRLLVRARGPFNEVLLEVYAIER
jgi:hypothetical protein